MWSEVARPGPESGLAFFVFKVKFVTFQAVLPSIVAHPLALEPQPPSTPHCTSGRMAALGHPEAVRGQVSPRGLRQRGGHVSRHRQVGPVPGPKQFMFVEHLNNLVWNFYNGFLLSKKVQFSFQIRIP